MLHLTDCRRFDDMAFEPDRDSHLSAGYCPLTFERLPRTRRAGGQTDTINQPRVRSAIPNRLYQAIRSSPLSMALTSRAR